MPTDTPTWTPEPTNTPTPDGGGGLGALNQAAAKPALPLPALADGAAIEPAAAITVVNRGAYVYWTFEGGSYNGRTNIVINGPVKRLYVPVIVR